MTRPTDESPWSLWLTLAVCTRVLTGWSSGRVAGWLSHGGHN